MKFRIYRISLTIYVLILEHGRRVPYFVSNNCADRSEPTVQLLSLSYILLWFLTMIVQKDPDDRKPQILIKKRPRLAIDHRQEK